MANLADSSRSRARLTLRALKQAAPWHPSPGSLDPRAVFPAETIRSIGNALIKARTVAVQAQRQQQSRAQQEMMALGRPMATPNPQ